MKKHEKKEASILIALVPVIFLVASLVFVLRAGLEEAHIALFMSAIFASLIGIFVLKYTWVEIEAGIVDIIKSSMGAIIILMIIGMVIGTWIASGIVPTMIYYGLKLLSPGIFLIAAVIISAIVSLATGSSWTTAATVGFALMGVGQGLGLEVPMIGGAVISGAYFGDKMSPLSDTTNLAPAVAGAKLFDHIKHMFYTTVPSLVITLIFFGILGFTIKDQAVDQSGIDSLLLALETTFNINLLLLLVPVIVIGAVVLKVPAIPGLFGGAVLGGIAMMVAQDLSLVDAFQAMMNGVSPDPDAWAVFIDTSDEILFTLLDRSGGGLQSMMWTVSLILSAMIFGGAMEVTGMLKALANGILSLAKGRGGLVLSTILTAIAMNIVAGDQYLAIVIPGRMYKQAYDDMGLHPKNLSRALEDSATLTSPLIPWNTCGASMIGFLGLTPWTYVPYCILNISNPIISVIYGYTGFSMHKADEKTEIVA